MFTGKHPFRSLFLIKLQAFRQHRCFPVNITKYLRTRILKNICERLLLQLDMGEHIFGTPIHSTLVGFWNFWSAVLALTISKYLTVSFFPSRSFKIFLSVLWFLISSVTKDLFTTVFWLPKSKRIHTSRNLWCNLWISVKTRRDMDIIEMATANAESDMNPAVINPLMPGGNKKVPYT